MSNDIFSRIDSIKTEDDCLVITLDNGWVYKIPINPKIYNKLGFLKILLEVEFHNDYNKTGFLIELSYAIYGSGLLGEVIYGSVIENIVPEYNVSGKIQYQVHFNRDWVLVETDGLSLSLEDIAKSI